VTNDLLNEAKIWVPYFFYSLLVDKASEQGRDK
jgi:hypothetical protein